MGNEVHWSLTSADVFYWTCYGVSQYRRDISIIDKAEDEIEPGIEIFGFDPMILGIDISINSMLSIKAGYTLPFFP